MIGVPLVVHCLADLQSVHVFRCCENSPNAERQRVLVLALYLVVFIITRSSQPIAIMTGYDAIPNWTVNVAVKGSHLTV